MLVGTLVRLTARSIPLLVAGALAAACASPERGAAASCDRYAAPSGSDRAGGSVAEPFRTPQRLADSLEPGETGCLRGGSYARRSQAGYVLRFGHGGRRGAPIVVRSAPGETARLEGVVYVPPGADHVQLRDLVFDDPTPFAESRQIAIQVMAADTVIADSEITTNRRKTCVLLGSRAYGRARRTLIQNNRFHDCGDPAKQMYDHAIYAQHTQDVRVVENTFFNTSGYALHLYTDAQGTVISRNVLDSNGGAVIFAGEGSNASSDNVVSENVMSNSKRAEHVSVYWGRRVGARNVVRDNCLSPLSRDPIQAGRGVTAQGNVVADPGFVNRAARDYRLRAGSGCRAVLGGASGTSGPLTVGAPVRAASR